MIRTGLPPGSLAAEFAYAGPVDAIAEYRAASEANDLDI